MTQIMNQFAQSEVKGSLDMAYNTTVLSVMLHSTAGVGLVAGQAVKVVDEADGVIKVIEVAANTDDVFGFINYDVRRATFTAGDYVEVSAVNGCVMYMEASAAIARWARVSVVVSGSKVVTASAALTVVGRAFDKAATTGDLIRVWILLPGESFAESAFSQAAVVAANSFTNVAAAAAGTAGGATPSAAQVDTGIATAVAALVTSTNLALAAIQTTVNAILTSIKAANLMASA